MTSPPLKPEIGVSSRSGSNSMAMPLAGRPLVMAKRMPASRRLCHGDLGALGQHLLFGDERAVDVRQHQGDLSLVCHRDLCGVGLFERAPGAPVARQQLVGRRGPWLPAS